MAVRDTQNGGVYQRPHLGVRRHLDLGDDLLSRIPDSVRHVDRRFGDEIDGAQAQRIERDGCTILRERRAHDHRHGAQPHEIAEKRETIHARHFDVEREHVGVEQFYFFASDVGVRRRSHDFDA